MIALLLTLLRPANTIAQDIKEIKGTITDSKGIPAAGVTVSVKSANYQTLTNKTGVFNLRAPQNGKQISPVPTSAIQLNRRLSQNRRY